MNDFVLECEKCKEEIKYIRIDRSFLGSPYIRCPNCKTKLFLKPEQIKLLKELLK